MIPEIGPVAPESVRTTTLISSELTPSTSSIETKTPDRSIRTTVSETKIPVKASSSIRKSARFIRHHADADTNHQKDPQILQDFLNYMLTIKGKSENTVHAYAYDLRMFFRFLLMYRGAAVLKDDSDESFHEIDLTGIRADLLAETDLSELYAFLSYVGRDRANKSHARARKVACMKSFFNYLVSKAKLMENNPTRELDTPKILKRQPRYLNLDESRHLLESIDGRSYERDYAMITLFLNCGMRLSELVSINTKDIRDNRLTIMGKGGKERTVYLNDACKSAIDAYLAIRPTEGVTDRAALFLSERKRRVGKTTVQHIVKKHIGAAGLDTSKYTTHKLRHTAATLMYKHGQVDIRALQEILGHESISTTEIYTHVDDKRLREAVESNPLSHTQPATDSERKRRSQKEPGDNP